MCAPNQRTIPDDSILAAESAIAGAMRPPQRSSRLCCSGALAVAVLLGLAGDAAAHLRRIGDSLVLALERSDALVIAEATGGTEDRRDASGQRVGAETGFRLREPIAGASPGDVFTVTSAPPPLRYARGQVAILALASDRIAGAVTWRATQGTGSALVLTEPLPAQTRAALVALWEVLPPRETGATPSEALATALERLLDAQPRKLALMAALDLADLGHAGRLPPVVANSLVKRLDDPKLSPELRPVLQHALAEPPAAVATRSPPEASAGGPRVEPSPAISSR